MSRSPGQGWSDHGKRCIDQQYAPTSIFLKKVKTATKINMLATETWVCGELLPELEGQQGWRLCLHHRDFEPGKPIVENITEAIYSSRKTICVISQHYLQSEWCSKEIQMASFRLFDEHKDVLILVFLEDIPAKQLSPYYQIRSLVKKSSYLSWPHAGQHTGIFWQKIRQALERVENPTDHTCLLTG
ncbi:toll-like receptor 13 isoform X2 [Oreochromis aureus]|uniref:toll-like receptor 13 isoform X2 n=1 Tax=Oreochromis aureus TaxID=47969 RepID=UPI001953D52C|nr:toll-like receptor 13 isoform X2 [Oreochromis aureus]